MNQQQLRDQMEQDIISLAQRYSISRLRISTIHFELDYQRGLRGGLSLVSQKAVIRALGQTSKVPIGEGEQYKTYEEAEEATKKRWSEYYKNRRETRSDKAKLGEQKRQRRYRENRKARDLKQQRQQ